MLAALFSMDCVGFRCHGGIGGNSLSDGSSSLACCVVICDGDGGVR